MGTELRLISRRVDGTVIEQRHIDGYINATAMCRAAGKLFADYARLKTSQAYLAELSTDMGIPISEIIQSVKGGGPDVPAPGPNPLIKFKKGGRLSWGVTFSTLAYQLTAEPNAT